MARLMAVPRRTRFSFPYGHRPASWRVDSLLRRLGRIFSLFNREQRHRLQQWPARFDWMAPLPLAHRWGVLILAGLIALLLLLPVSSPTPDAFGNHDGACPTIETPAASR